MRFMKGGFWQLLMVLFATLIMTRGTWGSFLFDEDWIDDNFNPKLAYFCAEVSADIYDFKDVKALLIASGFSSINLVDISGEDEGHLDVQAVVAVKKLGNGKNVVLISFRGSQEFKDWITDLDANSMRFLSDSSINVHEGFELSMEVFSAKEYEIELDGNSLASLINKATKGDDTYKFIICGHSLGGAIATLYGAYLYDIGVRNLVVYTYGAPSVGDDNFVSKFGGKLNLYRIINQYDPVPYSAYLAKFLNGFPFKHIGKMIVFDELL